MSLELPQPSVRARRRTAPIAAITTTGSRPAIKATTPLPANPDGVTLLESKIQQAAAPPQAEPVPPLPEIAQRVSGQTYVLDDNPLGLLSFSLAFQEEAEALMSLSFSIGPNETLDMEWLMALDNVYRFPPGEFGIPMGSKGWWESDNVVVILQDRTGNTVQVRISATFEDDQVTIAVEQSECGGPFDATGTLRGRLEE